MDNFDAAKLHPGLSPGVTHSGRSVVLLGKFQIPATQIPINDFRKGEIKISPFSSPEFETWNLDQEFLFKMISCCKPDNRYILFRQPSKTDPFLGLWIKPGCFLTVLPDQDY